MRAPPALVLTIAFGAASTACSVGDPASPRSSAPGASIQPAATIGPAPLRRMTDAEYLNALHDLFPALHPTLPDLPPDVPVAGFDNAAEAQQPSDVLVARYEAIANMYAEAATATPDGVRALTGCDDWSTADAATACATTFVNGTGARLFRRPLTTAESTRLLARFQGWQQAVDFEGAVQLSLSAMLQSPQFLYRPEPLPRGASAGTMVAVEPYAMATRLAFLLWQSIPDDALLRAAGDGTLATDDGVRAQAERMLDDPRAKRTLWSFHRQWLGLDRILLAEGAARTPDVDPAWTPATQAAAFTESELFVENVLGQGATFRDLLTSRRAWVNGEMARVYGLPSPSDPSAWTEVELPGAERAGLLTRAAFLAGYAHAGATSPPVRGNGIALRLLCSLPRSPPPGADLSQPTPPPGSGPQTNRMLFETRTSPPACQACHAQLNGFGFGLESYDAAGHFQTTDHGLPVDARGAVLGTDVDGPFAGGIALSDVLSQSGTVERCATEQWLRYALGRAPADIERPELDALAGAFAKSEGDVRALLLAIVTSPSFRMMRVEEAP